MRSSKTTKLKQRLFKNIQMQIVNTSRENLIVNVIRDKKNTKFFFSF